VVINELVTIETAREVYRVVLDPATRKIDWERTKALRAAAAISSTTIHAT
jgi:hypothetical protein